MKKIRFYKGLIIELIETLCSICLVLEKLAMRERVREGEYMHDHFCQLKHYSEEMRK